MGKVLRHVKAWAAAQRAAAAPAQKSSRVARAVLSDMFGPVASSYQAEQYEAALDHSAWLTASAFRLADAIGGIPPRVVRTGTEEEAEGPKAENIRKVLRKVNPEHTYRDFIEMAVIHLLLQGEIPIEKARNRLGEVIELWPLQPKHVSPIPDKTGRRWVSGYKVHGGAGRPDFELKPEDMVWIRFYNPTNPLRGQSSVSPIWNDLLADREASKFNRTLLSRGARIGGILMPKEHDLGEDELRALRASLEAAHSGSANAGKMLVLPYGIDYEADTASPKDLDFLNLRKFARETAAGVVGVPPVVVGNFDAASYANTDAQLKAFWDYRGRAMLEKIFGGLNEHWLHPEVDEQISVVPDVAAIEALVDSQKSRVDNATKLLSGGVYTVNEARRMMGKKPLPDGEKLLVPVNLQPMDPDKIETPEPPAPAPAAGDPNNPDNPNADDPNADDPKQTDKPAEKPARRAAAALPTSQKAIDRQTARDAHERALQRFERIVATAAKGYLVDARLRFASRVRMTTDPDVVLGSRDTEAREASKAILPAMLRVISEAGDLTLARLGKSRSAQRGKIGLDDLVTVLEAFDLQNPRVLSFIESTFLVHLDGVADVTIAAVRDALRAGIAAGDGVPELVARIERLSVFNADRAERVARTETIGAFNLGAQEAFRVAGVERKAWLSARDERARVSHAEADKATTARPILSSEAFQLEEPGRGKADLMFPGDPKGPAWAVVNCRCALLPVDELQLAAWVEHCKGELVTA